MKPLRMGTRASALARAQSSAAVDLFTKATGIPVEVVLVRTEGDQLSTEGKAPPGGDTTGVFTRALDEALREGRCDFAIHSLKDLPTETAEDLVLAAVPERADPRDALVVASRHAGIDALGALPEGSVVATSSPRRIAQVLRFRPDLRTVAMAGNVDTRLRKLEEGAADALLLACAGLDRLGLAERITRRIDPEELLSAPGQGALAIVCRASDGETLKALATQDHADTRAEALAERALLNQLRGGCRAPVGARARVHLGKLTLRGRVLSLDGREAIEVQVDGMPSDAEALGRKAADTLLSRGAERLVAESRAAGL